ncbi:hypothetical protein ACGF3J_11040 [Streptomyces sp. NPDC048171]|uniref:hypothetical protein n=1 Tax=Streptomyces sp. NPDC048171 TaxID=3365504 RepID=UPI003723FC4E
MSARPYAARRGRPGGSACARTTWLLRPSTLSGGRLQRAVPVRAVTPVAPGAVVPVPVPGEAAEPTWHAAMAVGMAVMFVLPL